MKKMTSKQVYQRGLEIAENADPQTLRLAIELLERMRHQRSVRAKGAV